MSEIKPGNTYKIKGNSIYFKNKYGTPNPQIVIEDKWITMERQSWGNSHGNPACMFFGMRSGIDGIPSDDANVWYGKIASLGELVHTTELEEI